MRYDFAIFDKSERLVAVLEAKAQRKTSAGWASQFRRNLFTHLGKPDTKFFGIVTPDSLYLWRESKASEMDGPPDFQLDLRASFDDLPPEALRGQAFELVVSSWLSELIEAESGVQPDLRGAGFVEAIRHGRMQIEAAA